MREDYDLIIVGGGLAGNGLALALRHTGLSIAVIEALSPAQLAASSAGDRALALAAGTVNMLAQWGVWQAVAEQATAIEHIHVSDRGHFGKTRLSARQQKVAAFGYVIVARDIESHLVEKVAEAGITRLSPCRLMGLMSGPDAINVSLKRGEEPLNLTAKLLVGADGGQSSVRRLLDIAQEVVDYRQTALVTTVKTQKPHHNTAFERFTPSGPLALLPVGKRLCSVVWTRSTEAAEALLLGSEADFLRELQACFGYFLGELSLAAPRRLFPLALIRAGRMSSGRAVIIGNAAHQLHPVAGQGFNLGLRDVAVLADMLNNAVQQGQDIGSAELLRTFASARSLDHDRVIRFTDGLVKLFSNDWPPLAAARNIGMMALDHLPFAKDVLAGRAMGLVGLPVAQSQLAQSGQNPVGEP